jgi:hypothetical protein
VIIGSGIGGIGSIADTAIELRDKGPASGQPLLHPLGVDQSHGGPGLHPPRLQGAQPFGGDGLRDGHPRRGRRLAADHVRRRRRDGGRAARSGDHALGIAGFIACRALSTATTTSRRRPRGPTTRGATASSWARARASWCWRSTSTPRRAGAKSTPRSRATACRRRLPHHRAHARTATAATAPCSRRSSMRAWRPPTSTTSTLTAPRPSWGRAGTRRGRAVAGQRRGQGA